MERIKLYCQFCEKLVANKIGIKAYDTRKYHERKCKKNPNRVK